MARHSAGPTSATGFQPKTPTVFTRTSRRPKALRVSLTRASASSNTVTSARQTRASPPVRCSSWPRASARLRSCRQFTTTRARCWASARTSPAPSPCPLPVTSTTLSRRPSCSVVRLMVSLPAMARLFPRDPGHLGGRGYTAKDLLDGGFPERAHPLLAAHLEDVLGG